MIDTWQVQITHNGTATNQFHGVLEQRRHDNETWGSICRRPTENEDDIRQKRKRKLNDICRSLGFRNRHPYVPVYLSRNPSTPMIWNSLLADSKPDVDQCNPDEQAFCIACESGRP